MGSLKRKEGPNGASASKPPRTATESRPSKRAKASESTKDDGKKGAKEQKSPAKPAAAPVVSKLKEEEPLFPRGGGSVLTPLEQKQISIQAKKDVLFEEQSEGKKGDNSARRKRRKSRAAEAGTGESKDEDAVKVEGLNFKRLVQGSLVLGTVCAINALDIVIALPNNLVGHVPITSISEPLTQRLEESAEKEEDDDEPEDEGVDDVDLKSLFQIGQYVRAYVTSTLDESAPGKSKRHIGLALDPAHSNTGISEQDVVENCTLMAAVASVEDHGFVMDISIAESKLRGFLPRKQLDKSIPEESLQPGSVLLCIVANKVASGKVVQLSTLSDRIGNPKSSPSEATTIGSFLPGTAADVLVSEVSQHGVVGKVMGHLDVTADLVHSGAGPDGVDIVAQYKVGSRIKARIICTFPNAKLPKLGISVLPHILSLKPKTANKDSQEILPTRILAHSATVDECTVQRVEPGIGLYVDVGVEGIPGFVHISRVKDGKVDSLFESSGPYKVGSVHPGRVVGYNNFDGMFLLSFEKKVLEQPFLRIEDIPVGAVVPGVVEKLVINQDGLGGLIVNIADGISGLVPEMHLSDVHLQHPEKKFREGMKVKARVLSTNPARHQLRLTLKKTLVNSEALPIKSYDELAVGLQAPGTIVNVLQHGAIVQFYGQLRGFLPVSEMSEAYISDPKEHFRVGQTLALKKLQIGDLVSAKVTQKTEDDIFVELTDNSLKAVLPVAHLTDKSVSKTQSALKKIHVNQTLSELVVLEKNEARRSITLSHKPSLVQASKEGKLLASADDARLGNEVAGFVRNITATAAFVQFAGKLTALLPKSKLPRDAQDKPSFGMYKSQSLTVKITSIDKDLGRLVVAIPSVADDEAKKVVKPTEKAINSLDDSITSADDLAIGKLTKARVKSAKETQLNVQIADNIQGRIDVSQVFDKWEDIPDAKRPLKRFKPNEILEVRVLGVHDARNHRFLPITHRSSHSVLELSTKPSDLKADTLPESLSLDKIEVGSTHVAFVNNVASNYLWVNLSPNVRGRINAMEASDDLAKLANLEKSFPVGSALQVRVLAVDKEKERVDLSARTSGEAAQLSWDKIQQGLVLPAKVTKVNDRQVIVKLSELVAGPVHLADLADDYDDANPLSHSRNEIVRVAVVEVDKSNKRVRLSMRPSKVLNSSLPVKDKEVTKNTKLEVGDIIRGFVRNVSDKGLFVSLGGDLVALVKIKNLSDSYLKDWKEHYQVDQLVKGRIISVAEGRIELNLKPSVVDKDYVPLTTIADLKEGQTITGKVRKVEEFGAFIEISGSMNLSGLCHRSEMADRNVKDARTLYNEGDRVKARVLKVDLEKKRINLGLKPSYFKDGEADDMDVDSEDEDAGAVLDGEESEDEEMSDAGGAILIGGSDDEDEDDEDGEDDSRCRNGGCGRRGPHRALMGRRQPQGIVDKTAELDINGPQTSSDYERLLLGQPDSSELWIAYMASQMQINDLASARQVAERAIKTINIKEETEKLNVWIAYLNLEVAYGTDETVEEVFKRACTYNDDQEVHERLASIYIQSGKHKASPPFSHLHPLCPLHNPTILTPSHRKPKPFLKTRSSRSTARGPHTSGSTTPTSCTRPRASRSADGRSSNAPRKSSATQPTQAAAAASAARPRHTFALLPKFAALEFRSPHGDREQGRTLFENLLATYPRKFDLWNQLLDLEVSVPVEDGDVAVVRDLFDRGSKVKGLKPRQAKAWFRRWAKWEEERGDAKSRERVSARAVEWARAAGKGKGSEAEDDGEEEE
ncbi:hypothetical protein CHGG_03087 [Chaetomium globosum CBS 148.51]|uniref:rRNA biogenesis protein RRP5 n=1 Tax=Chaetomium globosum (strain ATCC 6205 / CBS 148.51 / DSM 1962 / NBRC 6347 / NRRL 1970) TaxID=306901 RepID=Q2H9L7_CHAGB|nr:uncharacterized protein CHGG_03087 [Chaetomium globosum CBS 148.51]EAQ91152.1 hypothetical protein CHGG_03087 [Chaetomium globosum CBS 148.51]